ncbi:MAG: DNA repair protein RecN [Bacteroidales bacterium]|nr:DNA repair protein RecN [Bacteroidales bacterium]
MLTHLTVKNFALIRNLDISFNKNLSVITGETGAGKSILIGAMDLILGKRADTKVLMDKSAKCVVEGTFFIKAYNLQRFFVLNDLDFDNITIIRREITPQGKSRAFINDTPVNLSVLKELSYKLIDLHSQDQHLSLNDNDFQHLVVDSYAGILSEIGKYNSNYQSLLTIRKELEKLLNDEKQSNAEKDYLEFIYNELEEANLQSGEQENLENELKILNHTEEIKSVLNEIAQGLENENTGVVSTLTSLRNNLSKIASYSDDLNELSLRFESTSIELNDLLSEAEIINHRIEHKPQKISEINDRLNLIYSLQAKHRVNTIDELNFVKKNTHGKLDKIQSLNTSIEKKSLEITTIKKEVARQAQDISAKRQSVFSSLQKNIELSLLSLGMPNSKFKVSNTKLPEPGPKGIDAIQFLFNANMGGELQNISRVASGGEKSRLMLAVKSLLSQKKLLPTIVFDEVDAGISGRVADKVGSILQELSLTMQVIAITHLPQIAGKGNNHLLVYKESDKNSTQTQIKILDHEERIIEIAKLLSGSKVTNASMESAKHLLNN